MAMSAMVVGVGDVDAGGRGISKIERRQNKAARLFLADKSDK